MSDSDDFMSAMSDVKPIKKTDKIPLTQHSLDAKTLAARRSAAINETKAQQDPLAESEVPQLEATAILSYQRPGVQHGVFKQLRMGKYSVEARLDLHQMKVEQARHATYQFIRDCMAHDVRCALITHGKGEGRKNPAVLKSHIAHWLPQIKEVLAFHSAQKHHGGSGATYIMLKKSEKKRQENLERHQKR